MIIVHMDFTGTYNEEMNYQENILPRIHAEDGHTVFFITTCYRWKENIEEKVPPCNKKISKGIILIRLPYKHFLTEYIDKKIRAVEKLYDLLNEISPDIIMIHCIQTFACYSVMKYIDDHPRVKLYVDFHTDYYNSAKNFFSKQILHKYFYKPIAQKLSKYVKTFLCCSYEAMFFLKKEYGISEDKLEFYPLGGLIYCDDYYQRTRSTIRKELGCADNTILMVHSGKMNKNKKTVELVKAFHQIAVNDIMLCLVGAMDDYVCNEIAKIIEIDKRIRYLGWKDGEVLSKYLCACDVYCQPGTQSATMQNAACCNCALMLFPYPSHTYIFGENIPYYVKGVDEIKNVIAKIVANPKDLEQKKRQVSNIAIERLNYRKLARRLYEE